MIKLSTSLVLLVQKDKMLDSMSVSCLHSRRMVLSVSLSHPSRPFFIWTTLWKASQVLHTAQRPVWRRLTGRATVGSDIVWRKLDMTATLHMLKYFNHTAHLGGF